MNELNLNELEKVTGGRGGSPYRLPEKEHYWVYQIQSGDKLTKIAHRYGTTTQELMRINPSIDNINFIVTGYYIYIPER